MGFGGASASEEQSDQQKKDQGKGFTKVCYYEVLGCEKTATVKELAKGYKKASLKWHPDKNIDRDTTNEFQTINEAYQCLSDAQSRSWYDSHRDQILKGKDPGNMNEADETYMTKKDLKPYFKDSCYTFQTTASNNFFVVYDNLFERLDNEEEQEEEVGVNHFMAPRFGDPDSSQEDVFRFYDQWKYFTTGKQFAYADVYDPKEAPNRRVKRLIEAENKKERQKERVAFNEMVRELVSQIMEKDYRYRKFQLAVQQEKDAKRKKADEEKQAKLEVEREKLRKYREDLALQYQKEEEEAIARGDFEEVFVEEFRCEICKKTFKKEGQMDNHLKSKKHRDAESKLKSQITLDPETEELIRQENEKREAEQQRLKDEAEADADDNSDSEEETKQSKKKKKKGKQEAHVEEEEDPEDRNNIKIDDAEDWAWKSNSKTQKKNKVAANKKGKGGAQRGHEKIVEEEQKKYFDGVNKIKNLKLEKERLKKEQFEKKKAAKVEEEAKAAERKSKKAAKRQKQLEKRAQMKAEGEDYKSEENKSDKDSEENKKDSDNENSDDDVEDLAKKAQAMIDSDSELTEEKKKEEPEEIKVEAAEIQEGVKGKDNADDDKDKEGDSDGTSESESEESEDEFAYMSKKQKQKMMKKKQAMKAATEQLAQAEEPEELDPVQDDKINQKFKQLQDLKSKKKQKQKDKKKVGNVNIGEELQKEQEEDEPQMSKKEMRKAKKEGKEASTKLKCNVCNQAFDSKSKLFKHINATGHALRV